MSLPMLTLSPPINSSGFMSTSPSPRPIRFSPKAAMSQSVPVHSRDPLQTHYQALLYFGASTRPSTTDCPQPTPLKWIPPAPPPSTPTTSVYRGLQVKATGWDFIDDPGHPGGVREACQCMSIEARTGLNCCASVGSQHGWFNLDGNPAVRTLHRLPRGRTRKLCTESAHQISTPLRLTPYTAFLETNMQFNDQSLLSHSSRFHSAHNPEISTGDMMEAFKCATSHLPPSPAQPYTATPVEPRIHSSEPKWYQDPTIPKYTKLIGERREEPPGNCMDTDNHRERVCRAEQGAGIPSRGAPQRRPCAKPAST
ncbi:hypothetical protein BDK51DRAFT_51268 [Blyttiomyces helicus]|uniref:Uncharacterized protein n=1 Tax=Blyttiomyces helicus TaxID=388810 RepID=A0A4P9W7P5_9FUNG|nr:hypothetical protein BDK51DRAFT_51268 [Blyttiomyces helicus]|eukprot:RKO87068.1 hypothetical protein BDK51DRAFT_51268 [Blyttiomyces helicus]